MGNNGSRKAANQHMEQQSEPVSSKTVLRDDEEVEASEGSSTGQSGGGSSSTHQHNNNKNKVQGSNTNGGEITKLLLRGVKPDSLLEKIILSQPTRTGGLGLLNQLPDELLLHILSFSSIYDLLSLSQVSKTFYMLFSDDLLWKILYLNGMNSLIRDDNNNNNNEKEVNVLFFYKKKKNNEKGSGSNSIRLKQERKVQYMGSWKEVVQLNCCKFEDEYEEQPYQSSSSSSSSSSHHHHTSGTGKNNKKNGSSKQSYRKRYFIINEDVLGWPVKLTDDVFQTPDEVTHVAGTNVEAEYHYYNNVGIGVFFEDRGEGLVAISVLKRIDMEDVGTAYKKIVPPFYRDKILENWKKQTGNSNFSF